MKTLFFFALFYLVSCQHSLTDKCYVQYRKEPSDKLTGYQYFINSRGIPISRDWIVHEYVIGSNHTIISCSYYYHYVLICNKVKDGEYSCNSNCTSAWYKYVDESSNLNIKESCGSKFHNKYRNVMENECVINGQDYFRYVKDEIGKTSQDIIFMNGRKPAIMDNFYEGDKCDVDYEILGLWTIIIIIICFCLAIFFILLISIWIYAQKHRKEKRARLHSSLIQNEDDGFSV